MEYQEFAVSPHFKQYRDDPRVFVDDRNEQKYPFDTLSTAILVYQDKVDGWFLRYGAALKEDQNAGFVVLLLAVSQIEGMEQYFRGESSDGKSRAFLVAAMKRIFRLSDDCEDWLGTFYSSCRCGIFHDGSTGRSVVIGAEFEAPITFINGNVEINPNLFFDEVRNAFLDYIQQLKDERDVDLRMKFRRFTEARTRRDPQLANFILRD